MRSVRTRKRRMILPLIDNTEVPRIVKADLSDRPGDESTERLVLGERDGNRKFAPLGTCEKRHNHEADEDCQTKRKPKLTKSNYVFFAHGSQKALQRLPKELSGSACNTSWEEEEMAVPPPLNVIKVQLAHPNHKAYSSAPKLDEVQVVDGERAQLLRIAELECDLAEIALQDALQPDHPVVDGVVVIDRQFERRSAIPCGLDLAKIRATKEQNAMYRGVWTVQDEADVPGNLKEQCAMSE